MNRAKLAEVKVFAWFVVFGFSWLIPRAPKEEPRFNFSKSFSLVRGKYRHLEPIRTNRRGVLRTPRFPTISRASAQNLGGVVVTLPPGTNTLVTAINANNAVGITFQLQPGTYS